MHLAQTLAAAMAVTFLFAGTVLAQQAPAVPASATAPRVLGSPDAPVQVIEYASLTCHHCATFHNEVLPQVKKEFIDTGKVRLVYRDFPLDQLEDTHGVGATVRVRIGASESAGRITRRGS